MRHPLIAALILVATGFAYAEQSAPDSPCVGPVRAKILKRFDQDGDGKLNEQERAAAREGLAKRLERFREKHPKLFAKMDQDGDGKLNREELRAMRKALLKHRGERGEGRKQGGRRDQTGV
jgi:hypothetical protein